MREIKNSQNLLEDYVSS